MAIGMLQFVFSIMSKEHQVKGCCMRTEVIPRLLATVMQTGQTGSPTDRRSTLGYCVFIGGNLIS